MGLSTQLLLWAFVAGIVVAALLEARWRAAAPHPFVWAAAAVVVVVSGVWMAVLDLYGAAHLLYLQATVVPACVVVAAVATPSGRSRLQGARARIGVAALLVPPVVGLYASHIEPFWLRVDRVEAVTDAGAGLRVGVFSDLQSGEVGDYEWEAARRLIDTEPDVILVPGDLWQVPERSIDERWPEWAALIEEMVDAVGPVLLVEGDTDHYRWIELIAEASGAILVHDRVERLEVDGVTVHVGGVQHSPRRPRPASEVAMTELASLEADDVVTIALSHAPDIVDWLPGPVDLVVAGDTHGGQIQLPFIGPVFNASGVPRAVAGGGLHELDGQLIYVSTGIGVERRQAPQVRLNVRPSVGVIDLVAPRSTQ